MKISIALCTYNGEKFLNEQLESFLKQTRLPDELIIGDDRSSDKTCKIIEQFAKTSPFSVHFQINENNLGSTKNFDQTILRCNGDIIFLSDQDDVWNPEKIEQTANVFVENKEVGMVFTNAEIVDQNLISINKNLWDFTFEKEQRGLKFFDVLMRRNVVTGATMAFRAKFVKMFSPIPVEIPNTIHDGWISLVIAANAQVIHLDQCLIKYRQHPNQQLGINLNLKNKNRFEVYQNSILFHKNELERLLMMNNLLPNYSQFCNVKSEISEIVRRNLIEKKALIKHYQTRLNLPKNRINRVIPILSEFKSGRYTKFSKGWKSAAKDLVEKH